MFEGAYLQRYCVFNAHMFFEGVVLMSGFVPIFIFVGVFSCILFFGSLNWYRLKEIREQRALDLQIIALDHDAEFKESDSKFKSRLTYLIGDTRFSMSARHNIRNIISKRYIDYQSFFFDIEISKSGDSSKVIERHGVFVELKTKASLNFHVGPKGLFDWLTLTGYPRIEPYLNPKWMRPELTIFTARESQKAVHDLLNQSRSLIELIGDRRLQSMVVRDKHVVLIYKGRRPSTLAQYQLQTIRAAKVAQTFVQQPFEDELPITILKTSV